jgi:hypothetical protein
MVSRYSGCEQPWCSVKIEQSAVRRRGQQARWSQARAATHGCAIVYIFQTGRQHHRYQPRLSATGTGPNAFTADGGSTTIEIYVADLTASKTDQPAVPRTNRGVFLYS